MHVPTVVWLVFLATVKNFSYGTKILFEHVDSQLTAKEGSCVELKSRRVADADGAYWYWIKNAQWDNRLYTGTIIYSTDNKKHPVGADFADRVKYIGTPSSSWKDNRQYTGEYSILICNLTQNDSGPYSFRFEGTQMWLTKPAVALKVTDNPCPITFKKPPIVRESDSITLECSTSISCLTSPEIRGLTHSSSTRSQTQDQNRKISTVSFKANWEDDGREFSCQAQDEDKYLIRNISVTVEYAPKNTSAKKSPENVVESRSVTLTCSAKGRADPINFSWFVNGRPANQPGASWTIQSFREWQNGKYHCEAKNKHGTTKSNEVIINAQYAPEVEVKSPTSVVTQGSKMSLTCHVKRSYPQPDAYVWFKDGKSVSQTQTRQSYVVESIEPEDGGFYRCKATNRVNTTASEPFQIEVQYGPRKVSISIRKDDKEVLPLVGVGSSLTFSCEADANPSPQTYSWYRHNHSEQIHSNQRKFKTTKDNWLRLDAVKRADEGCYLCNATNTINTGEGSKEECIQVVYAPTEPTLSMDTEVREGQLVTIGCTVESFPPSKLTLTRTSTSNPQPSVLHFAQLDDVLPNTLRHEFNVTSAHAGFYTCGATNRKGSKTSNQTTLVVKYRPKNVTVKATPDFDVNEKTSLALRCSAQSHPPVTSVTWMKTTDGKSEIVEKSLTFILKSVRPADSGLYSCAARNDMGIGNSLQAEVKVKYAPKHTEITRAAEHRLPDGTTSVMLSCSSHSYPLVTHYSWYKVKAEARDERVSDRQNYTVYSDQPGVYYCIAKNEINQKSSDSVRLFDQSLTKALSIFFFLLILLIILIIFLVYRHKRKKSSQQGWWNGTRRRNQMNDPGMPGPFRSRDDLVTDQPHRPDSTPASDINSVYCTVNQPSGTQGPSAHSQDDSLNYASLHFKDKQKSKQSNDVVYAVVSKLKPPKKTEERLEDYENVSTAHKAIAPCPLKSDTDTSEDEVEVNYTRVNFKAKPGHQRASRDSSSSDEEETQYTEVKI